MRFGLDVPTSGEYADPRLLAELAAEAETAGWDGFFVWDILTGAERGTPVTDAWVALAAIALHTSRMRIGTMVTPLVRRRPWLVAREAVALDQLSGGRMTLVVGLGASERDFTPFGDEFDARSRAEKLDEALAIVSGLWTGEPFSFEGRHYHLRDVTLLPRPAQQPRIPIWVAGGWPHRAPFRRAARWDGALLMPINRVSYDVLTPAEVREIVAFLRSQRTTDDPFDVLMSEETPGDAAQAADIVQPYAEAGATCWIEHPYGRATLAEYRERILSGPPRM
jgi:alkanesulfonate monooxygenase SsuD/methylene tetrahydromethanopterin reductase-like flavin-dependent oxidoreductase (luciferase family)